MTLNEIELEIAAIESDLTLLEERNFDHRIETTDFIGYNLIPGIEELLKSPGKGDQLMALKRRAEKARITLEEFDRTLFAILREKIREGAYTGQNFIQLAGKYGDLTFGNVQKHDEPGYDTLDIFVNGLLSFDAMPKQTKELEPGMVFYQKTPARIVFEMVEKLNFTKQDVFFDIGSGLGQAVMLVNLLTGVTVAGVEFEPAFCAYAQCCAASLNLSNVSFFNVDARGADYSKGTVFFMYTPFSGNMLDDVLDKLKKESMTRKITIVTYGPCAEQVALQNWLAMAGPKGDNIYKPAVFNSI